jgi:hypothetical protein
MVEEYQSVMISSEMISYLGTNHDGLILLHHGILSNLLAYYLTGFWAMRTRRGEMMRIVIMK